MTKLIFTILYTAALFGLSFYGIHALILSFLFLVLRRRPTQKTPPPPEVWPKVTVQLPMYNERFVVERLIEAACNLDYPPQALSIQVLDDSTDETTALARQQVALYRAQGINIELHHRVDRGGFKAGALAEGLKIAPGEYVAIFDADFVPPSDFLRNLIPYLVADPRLGMVQARWGHLNDGYNLLTRGQALLLDGHFVVEQTTRSRSGLLFNFNGSAGVWRRACIDDAGGWQGDTLSEDLDLSYRAQLKGWHFAFVPDVIAPAEIPPQVAALKQQQYRWARGSIQVLRKMSGRILRAPLTLSQKVMAFLHLSAYLTHPLMMLLLLVCLPVVLVHGAGLPSLQWLSLAGFGPPLLFALSQWAVYPNWKQRILFFPILMGLGVGIAFNNTRAVLAGFSPRPAQFIRTPKFHLETQRDSWSGKAYRLPVEWSVWIELLLAGYALATALLASKEFPPLVPMLILFTLGFGYVGLLGLWQGIGPSIQGFGQHKAQGAQPH